MAPSTYSATGKSRFAQWFIKRAFSQKPKVSRRKCKGCGKCRDHCPVKAIEMKPRGKNRPPYASFDYGKCIRCFCCQELCPFNLVKIKTPLLVKIMKRSKKRRLTRKK
jgi:ferredoxin